MNVTLITVGAFVLISLTLYVLGRLIVGGRRNDAANAPQRPLALGPLTRPFAASLPALADEELPKDLRRAGFYHPLALKEYLAVRNALVWGWLTLCVVAYAAIVRYQPSILLFFFVLSIVILVLCYSVPRLILQAQAAARMQRIQRSLPDGLDMITMVMEGGLPLVSALEHVSREIGTAHPDLACELGIVARHTRARSLDDALRKFADRIDTPDVQSLAALVSYAERLGSNVVGAFREFADSIRRSFRQRAEERGNKASVKLLFPIVLCLAPPVYILLLAPAMLELRNFVIQQNRPGGILSQESVSTSAGPITPTNYDGSIFRPAPPTAPDGSPIR
jgi:tight adherence protein C